MKKWILNAILVVGIILTLVMLAVGIFVGVYATQNIEREIDESIFEAISTSTASTIYYYDNAEARLADNATILADSDIYGGFRNTPVEYEDIPQDLIDAFISIEDKRFFQHSGVDWKRTVGATVNYFLKFRNEFGGSTITQQLIKNVTGEDGYSLKRKLQEIFWAVDLESKMSKEEITYCWFPGRNSSMPSFIRLCRRTGSYLWTGKRRRPWQGVPSWTRGTTL